MRDIIEERKVGVYMFYSTMEVFGRKVYVARDLVGITYLGSPLDDKEYMIEYFKDIPLERDDTKFDDLRQQMREFESNRRSYFNLPLHMIGTEFRLSVWKALQTIPYGTIVTYTDVAKMIGKPKAVRAVASAIGKNPLMILVPCHRVNGKNGGLHGFGGGLDLKVELQDLELPL